MGGQLADQNALMQQQYGLAGQYAALNQQINQQVAVASTFPGIKPLHYIYIYIYFPLEK